MHHLFVQIISVILMTIPLHFYVNILCLLIWSLYKSRFRDTILIIVGYYLLFALLVESTAWLYSYFMGMSNHWIYNIYTTAQTEILFFIYYRIFMKPLNKKITRLIFIIYPLLVVINLLYFQDFFRFHTYTYIIGCILILYLSFSYLQELLNAVVLIPIRKTPFFWVNTGNIIYYAGSMFYLGSLNYIVDKELDYFGRLIEIFVYAFNSIQYVLFAIGFLCSLKPKRK